MSLMEQFSDPNLIGNLTFGEKMLGSTITMIMGLGITFTILILIWIFIAIMGKCMDIANRPKKTKALEPAAEVAPAAAVAEAPAAEDETGLIAVIAAAIAAYEGANANNLVVKKITRLSGEQTPWGNFALEDRLDTRKM